MYKILGTTLCKKRRDVCCYYTVGLVNGGHNKNVMKAKVCWGSAFSHSCGWTGTEVSEPTWKPV